MTFFSTVKDSINEEYLVLLLLQYEKILIIQSHILYLKIFSLKKKKVSQCCTAHVSKINAFTQSIGEKKIIKYSNISPNLDIYVP